MGIPEIRELDRILYPLLPGTALTGGWLPLVYAVGHQDDDMNEMAALSYLLEHPETELCPETILTLFELMTEGTAMAGQGFKAENNRVASKDYFYIPVSAEKTPAAIDELCEKYGYLNHPQDDRTEDVFKFLLEFICIHPMKNGNGRLSALLVQQLLFKAGYRCALYLPYDITLHRFHAVEYQLRIIQASGMFYGHKPFDYDPFVGFQLRVLEESYQKLESAVKKAE